MIQCGWTLWHERSSVHSSVTEVHVRQRGGVRQLGSELRELQSFRELQRDQSEGRRALGLHHEHSNSSSLSSAMLSLSFFVFLPLVCVSISLRCGPCDQDLCAPLPAEGCPAGAVLDGCGCCSVCAAVEGEPCGGRLLAARRCASGLECVRGDNDKKSKVGVCVCKNNYEVCGSDGVTYKTGCALKDANLKAQKEGKADITIQNKGRCATGETDRM